MPIVITRQHLVHVQQRALVVLKDILPVYTGAGPVHQPMRLIGGVVKHIHANILCYLAGHRLILIGITWAG